MQALTNKARLVDRKPMTWVERIYLWNILKGMSITLRHLFKRKATISYPEQKRTFSSVFRGLHVLNRDEEVVSVVRPVDSVHWLARQKQSLWKVRNVRKVKNICIAKRSMLQSMRSTCCGVFSAVCVKRPVLKMRFT